MSVFDVRELFHDGVGVLQWTVDRVVGEEQYSLQQNVTVLGNEYHLESPFMVSVTQNPVEQEGMYPLPAAQLDRFMSLIELNFPNEDEETHWFRRIKINPPVS